jgi:hypothetical protein
VGLSVGYLAPTFRVHVIQPEGYMTPILRGAQLALAVVTLLVVVTAVAAGEHGPEARAEVAASEWLALMDRAQYEASWGQASSLFQGAVTAERWAEQAVALRAQVGEPASREVAQVQPVTDPPGAPPGSYVNIVYRSEFSVLGEATEVVALVDEGERGWRVVGYFVQPPLGG